jgi:2-polyprenyl-3-methyl-5-hydroxy-6-metoxy-1,4-benzoquinol methylase
MKEEIAQKLLHINQEFYQRFAEAFAETRRRIQPGVACVLAEFIRDGDWLDLGCGSGALFTSWVKSGTKGSYTGLDFSAELLAEASKNMLEQPAHEGLEVLYIQADLMKPDWSGKLPKQQYDGILAFASLHHLPGSWNRQRIIKDAFALLKPGGVFIHSEWQFQHSAKMMSRVLPWSTVRIDAEELEEGDTLLDWRHAAAGQGSEPGLRYVHLFTREELAGLAESVKAKAVSEFESDGRGGNLTLYQVWEKGS